MLIGWGFQNAVEGLRECDQLLEEFSGTSLEPPLRGARAMHLSFLGCADESRREHDVAENLFAQFGNMLMFSASGMSLADEELRAGRFDAAEAAAREGIKRLESLGEKGFLSSTLAQLAEVLVRSERFDEAEEVARETAELGADDDFDPMYRWRVVQARVLAHRGEHEEAERLAREAVEIMEATDWYVQRGDAHAVLGEVLEVAGKTDEARGSYARAIAFFDLKGAVVDADRIRRRLS
jgi:tetratricopeptide (TPR) repeat protein